MAASTTAADWESIEAQHLQGRGRVWALISTNPGVLRVRDQARQLNLDGDTEGALALLDRLASDGYAPELERRPRASRVTASAHLPNTRPRVAPRPRERRERRTRRSSSSGDDSSGSTSDSDSDPPGVGGALHAARRWAA